MKKILYLFIPACLIASSGCDKKIELTNPNQLTTSSFWQTREQAYAASSSIYSALIIDGSYMRSFPGLTDSRGDDFTGDSPWLDLVLTGQFIIPPTSAPVFWIWREFYQVVNRANQVLTNVPKYDAAVLSTEEKNRILGQAYFLRGLAYYNLATTFKTVPVITKELESTSEFFAATATEEVLWKQIFDDFAAAEANLPISYANVTGLDKGEKGRATKGAAAGMLGKSYLYRKDYAKAAIQFEKFFAGGALAGVYSLMPDYRDNFRDVNENNAESLFEIQFTPGTGTDMNWCCDPSAAWKQVQTISITYGQEGKGFSDYLPTRWIYDEYKLERTTANKLDPRLLTTIASHEPTENSILSYGGTWNNPLTAIYPRKYTNDGVGNGKPDEFSPFGESGINYRVIRYADILLMYAEVLNELNRTAEAYPFIQQVRTRASLPNLATVKPNMTQAQMRDQLAHERALEFAIEGQRINDLIRWGWFANPAKLAELKSHDPDFNFYTPGNEYLPIPQQELDVNKNLLPNSAN
ncbi:RagB/SusD family nutrient uptake outer membrane protein [Ferruginibacter sp.]|nr:RagB/SusD family nutrient uptake outer membrane protein [Ferruginibacter sp.]